MLAESLFSQYLNHGALDNLQQDIIEVIKGEMVSRTKQDTRIDGPVSTSPVYFRVLDLRVKSRLVNGKQIGPYCVLRLGDRHHRSGTFPADGLQLGSRRTTVDDRQLPASNDGDAGNPGVWWKIPTSYMTPDSCSRRCGVAKVCGDEDKKAEGRREQRCERQKEEDLSFRDSCQEDILLEVYNTADMDTGMSIDGFEAERLGVLRIKLSDIWTQGISSQPAAGRIRAGSQPGAGEPRAGHADSTTMPAGYSDATLHACEAGEAETQQCRTDRWLGGIVSPSCSRQHNGSASADSGIPASDQYIVEARLEASWGGCTCGRSDKPLHDSFGQAVDPRNTSKSLSAQRLWALQEPLQRMRWKSEAGRTVLSAFQTQNRCAELPRTKRRNARRAEEWAGELRELVWNGVPAEMREEVYMSLSGARSKQRLYDSVYYDILVKTCQRLEDEDNEVHDVAREGKENESDDTVKSGRRTRPVADPDQHIPSVDCEEGTGLNGISWKRSASKDHASLVAQGGSVDLMEDAGPDRSLQGVRNEKQQDGRASSGLFKVADEPFTPHEIKLHRKVWREIESDVDRVFTNGKSRVNSATGMATIRRVLRAYSLHNPAVGYCQGMNFVAGFLLEVVSEEAAFWLLDFFCEDLNPDYHTKCMLGARSDIAALKDVLRSELPGFHSRASEVGLPLELKLTQWLLVGFVNCFPSCTALRLFEVSFLEGSDVYFATALAFLRLHETEILQGEDIADVVCTLDRAQAGMYEADILLNQAWRELTLRGKQMRTARVWHRNRVLRQQEALTETHAKGPRMGSGACHGDDGHSADEQDGWLQGRSSAGAGGSAWLVLVPKALADQLEAILRSLNQRALGTTRGALPDGKLARPSLMPLLVGGVRWLMGSKPLEA